MDKDTDTRRPQPRKTHFDQVPLEIVKRIARRDDEPVARDGDEGIVVKVEPYSVPPDRLKKSGR
jgi:hypothetical protein